MRRSRKREDTGDKVVPFAAKLKETLGSRRHRPNPRRRRNLKALLSAIDAGLHGTGATAAQPPPRTEPLRGLRLAQDSVCRSPPRELDLHREPWAGEYDFGQSEPRSQTRFHEISSFSTATLNPTFLEEI